MPSPPMPATRIRVLLVDDSPIALVLLKRMLAGSPDIEVVGTARNGQEALDLIPRVRPDVICTDYHMPVMNGLELTREVMVKCPCPILVISSAVRPDDTKTVFPLLQAGAVDVFAKPQDALQPDPKLAAQLINRIKILSGVVVFRRRPAEAAATEKPPRDRPAADLREPATRDPGEGTAAEASGAGRLPVARIIAIGASTGGPQALQQIFSRLPASFPVPLVCVQHISKGFLQGLIDWLSSQSALSIRIARSGELPEAGTVYFPEEDTHLSFDSRRRLVTQGGPPVGGHRPAVTVTFQAVASRYGNSAVAVLLTGMGSDGCEGMRAVAAAGGTTIAQDGASCVVFGMPKQAIDLGVVRYVLPPPEIPALLLKCVSANANSV